MNNRITVAVDPDLEELIPGFLQNRQKDVQSLRSALHAGAMQTIQSIGHSLKGVGGGYGFNRISEIGAEFEEAAEQGDNETIKVLIAELQDYLARVEVVYQE